MEVGDHIHPPASLPPTKKKLPIEKEAGGRPEP